MFLLAKTLSVSAEVEIVAVIANIGGVTESSFAVHVLTENGLVHSTRIIGLPADGEYRMTTTWTAEQGIDRVTVIVDADNEVVEVDEDCLLYTSPSPRDGLLSRMPSSA